MLTGFNKGDMGGIKFPPRYQNICRRDFCSSGRDYSLVTSHPSVDATLSPLL